MPDLIRAILLGFIEGITEFLPISSTGHMKLADVLFRAKPGDPFWDMFIVFIQIGAIAAVVVYFHDRILELLRGRPERRLTPLEISSHVTGNPITATGSAGIVEYASTIPAHSAGDEIPPTAAQRGYTILMILLASLPLVVCYFADKWAERNLANTSLIAWVLIIGGIIMIVIEWLPLNITTRRIENITWTQALGIGCAQIIAAIFPGTSRSAATIMAGLVGGLSRSAAAEFSFFLAIPAMLGACTFKLLKYIRHTEHFTAQNIVLLAIGTIVSFLVAWAVIALFMAYIRRHSFIPFAIYRIIIGIIAVFLLRH